MMRIRSPASVLSKNVIRKTNLYCSNSTSSSGRTFLRCGVPLSTSSAAGANGPLIQMMIHHRHNHGIIGASSFQKQTYSSSHGEWMSGMVMSTIQTDVPKNRIVIPTVGCGSSSSSSSTKGVRFLSSFLSSPLDWWQDRQANKQAEKFQENIKEMGELEVWTLGSHLDQIKTATDSWASKIPGIRNMEQVQAAKKIHALISGLIAVTGRDATDDVVSNLSRVDKLKAAVAGETTVDDINLFISQFASMSIVHRVLRKRKLEGKPIPASQEALQTIVQAEGKHVLTKAERSKLISKLTGSTKKSLRRR